MLPHSLSKNSKNATLVLLVILLAFTTGSFGGIHGDIFVLRLALDQT